jgi:hypothetical protein
MVRAHHSAGNIISKGSLTSSNVYESLGETYHRAGITLKLGRVPVYFLGKYVLNISLIVLMALSTLVFDNGSENGFAVPVACFMGIVSWMFVLAAQIPVLGYNTRLDDFMAASYLTVFLVVLFSCYRIKRSRNPKPDDSSSSTVVPYTASDAKHNAGDAKVQVSSPGRCSRCFSCCFHWVLHPILIHVRPSSRLPPPPPYYRRLTLPSVHLLRRLGGPRFHHYVLGAAVFLKCSRVMAGMPYVHAIAHSHTYDFTFEK